MQLAACLASCVERKSSEGIGEENPTGLENHIKSLGNGFLNHSGRQVIRFLNHVKKITKVLIGRFSVKKTNNQYISSQSGIEKKTYENLFLFLTCAYVSVIMTA